MKRDLKDRVLVITGASSGIGAATAVEAGAAGMRIVLAARRRDRLERVADAVRARGGRAEVIVTDVSDPDQVQRLTTLTVQHFGRIDALFANAGFGLFERIIEAGDERAEQDMWRINYFAALDCARCAARVMIEQGGGGHLLFCSSIAAYTGLPYKPTYAATKAALHGLATSLRIELCRHRIDVTTVYPIATDTEFASHADRRSDPESPRARTPGGMIQTPRHVARRVVACMRRPGPEVWPSRASHLAAAVWSLFPRLRTACFRGHL